MPRAASLEQHSCRTLVENVRDVSGAGAEWRLSEHR